MSIDDWSPDGAKVAFYDTCTVEGTCYSGISTQPADGSSPPTKLEDGYGTHPHWSPDGKKIVFRSPRENGPCCGRPNFLYTINADGTGLFRVTTHNTVESSWQPIPINSYPRPKSATPFDVSLVPAYTQCTAPNRTHGPSLGFGSCNPPTTASDELTLGAPDVNGKPVRATGLVQYAALAGDVRITVALKDVYDQQPLGDYSGELRVRTGLRITDKLNTPHPGGPGAATVSDTTLGATVTCTVTADPDTGAACNLLTSANTLVPGTVTAGKRSVWGLGQVQVDDGGADGDAYTPGDNTLSWCRAYSYRSRVDGCSSQAAARTVDTLCRESDM